MPVAVLPGVQGARIAKSGVTVVLSFPVNRGRLNARPLQATIGHASGILFLDPMTGKQIEVSSFVINVDERLLTAIVNGNPKRAGAVAAAAWIRLRQGLRRSAPVCPRPALSGRPRTRCCASDISDHAALSARRLTALRAASN